MKSSGIHFQNEKFTLIHDDVLTTSLVDNNSVDLVITSPPYNVDIQYNSHKDDVSYADYLEFSRKWMKRCFQWLKEDGRFCLNVPLDKNKGGQQSVGADLTTIAKEVGFHYHSTIVWNEGNISRRTAWGSWKSASAPYVIAPVELIVVLYKEKWKKTSGSKISDIERNEFMDWTNGLWTFNGESKKRIGHPAPFPIELPRRCIKLFSYVDDVVLDPFCGSGTTVLAAVDNNRKGIGIDVDKKYCELARKRVFGIAPETKAKVSKKKQMADTNSRNKFDKKDSLELGENAEYLFIILAIKLGWKVSASSKDENINEHWDFLIEKDDESFKVEVKSKKRINRSDKDEQIALIWVELRNVKGETGWLFGKADLIAFEKEKSFIIVKRLDLLALVNKKVDLVAKVRDPKDALYKVYTRAGRKDKLTLLPTNDIEEIKFMEWKKV